jgi:endonuclease/exonuclease/phosphatase family metal-dependent hydrolase
MSIDRFSATIALALALLGCRGEVTIGTKVPGRAEVPPDETVEGVTVDDGDEDFPELWGEERDDFCNATDPSRVFKVVSWNINRRLLETRRNARAFDKLVRIIRDELQPDLMLLQEVTQDGGEADELRTQLGKDFKMVMSVAAGGERLAVIYNAAVLRAEPAPKGTKTTISDVALTRQPPGVASMVRQPLAVYVRVIAPGPIAPGKHAFDGYFMNVHTRPRAPSSELDLLARTYNNFVTTEPDRILVGDLNRTPTSKAMQDNFSNVFPVLRKRAPATRTSSPFGTLYRNAQEPLVDNMLIPPPTIEDFVAASVVPFDQQAINQPPEEITDHRPIVATFCRANDSDP